MAFEIIAENVTEIDIDGIGKLVLEQPAKTVEKSNVAITDWKNNKGESVPPITRNVVRIKQGESVLASFESDKPGTVWAFYHINLAE